MIVRPFPTPTAIYTRVLLLIAVGWLVAVVACVSLNERTQPSHFVFGLLVGTIFQWTVLAAAWGALGPGHLLWRIPLSFVWACAMGSTLAVTLALLEGSPEAGVVFMLITTGLWVVALLPLWLAAFAFGLRLRYQYDEERAEDSAGERQFGIGQLMIFTSFVAVSLGLGRFVLGSNLVPDADREFISIMAIVMITQVLVSLPLIFAGLLQQRVALATVIGLGFVVVITVAERITFAQIVPRAIPPSEFGLVTWVNIHSTIWILIFTAVVRGAGYRLGLPERGILYLGPLQQRESASGEGIVFPPPPI